jgi:hypothetical protein
MAISPFFGLASAGGKRAAVARRTRRSATRSFGLYVGRFRARRAKARPGTQPSGPP